MLPSSAKRPVNWGLLLGLLLLAASVASGRDAERLSKQAQAHLDMGIYHAERAEAASEEGARDTAAEERKLATAEFEKALAQWRHVLEMRPRSMELHARIATALTMLQRYREAEAVLRDALAIDPKSSMALYHLGALYMHEGRYDDAKEKLHVTLELTPWYPNAQYLLGYMLEKEGRYAEAGAMYVAERRVNPPNPNAVYRLLKLQMEGKFGRNWDQEVQWSASKVVSITITLVFGLSVFIYAWISRARAGTDILLAEDAPKEGPRDELGLAQDANQSMGAQRDP